MSKRLRILEIITRLSPLAVTVPGCASGYWQKRDFEATRFTSNELLYVQDHDGLKSIAVYDNAGNEIFSREIDDYFTHKSFSVSANLLKKIKIRVTDRRGNSFEKVIPKVKSHEEGISSQWGIRL